jgi:hypothetical protein
MRLRFMSALTAALALGAASLATATASAATTSATTTASAATASAATANPLASLTTSPKGLHPDFSPSIHDYVLRCDQGINHLKIAMSAVAGGTVRLLAPKATAPQASKTAHLDVPENSAIVIEAADSGGSTSQYWVRCLPHDFPRLKITTHPQNGRPTPGWYLTGTLFPNATTGGYAMILDTNGTPVWYRKGARGAAVNVTPLGHDEVAFSKFVAQVGFGFDPKAYYDVFNLGTGTDKHVATVGTPTDLHEFQRLPNGDYVMLSYPFTSGVDLSAIGGPSNATIAGCTIQEVSPSGALVWEWTGTDHLDPIKESTGPARVKLPDGRVVYDVFHCNSVDVNKSGQLLLSARNMNAVFKIDRATKKIIWKLGGTAYSKDGAELITVDDPAAGTFSQQHDARFRPGTDISLFDDHGPDRGPAQGIEYKIDVANYRATPVFRYTEPNGTTSMATGSFRRYSDGESVVCWGINPDRTTFTEVNALAQPVLDVAFDPGLKAYRAVKAPFDNYDLSVLRLTAGL